VGGEFYGERFPPTFVLLILWLCGGGLESPQKI